MPTGWHPCWRPSGPSWAPATGEPLLEQLRALFEPIMLQSDEICDGIGYPVELVIGPETVILDFPKRAVRERIPDEKVRYGFAIAPELVRTVLRDHEPDWVNTIFLSTRFKAWRVGGYNEYLYTFFKCLTDERIAYADGWFAETHDDSASITLDGWEIQRRCPHLKADLSKFGVVEGNTLTCNLHGWQWRLDDGRCLTSRGHRAAELPGMSDDCYDDGAGPAGPRRRSRCAATTFPPARRRSSRWTRSADTKPSRWACSSQRFSIWGSPDLRRWLPLDVHRPFKSTLITLDMPGTWPSPAFTPARPDEFTALLDELLSQRG